LTSIRLREYLVRRELVRREQRVSGGTEEGEGGWRVTDDGVNEVNSLSVNEVNSLKGHTRGRSQRSLSSDRRSPRAASDAYTYRYIVTRKVGCRYI